MALQATKSTGKKWDMVLYRFKQSKDTQSFIDYIETTNKDPLNSKAEDIPCQQIDNYRVLAKKQYFTKYNKEKAKNKETEYNIYLIEKINQ